MELKFYLQRIGIDRIKKPSLEFLAELQMKHLLAVPFEDLDIPDRARIILDLNRIYDKIIPTKRGGFCYELNGLFHWLLTQLGYKVDMLSARVYNHSKKELGPEFDHMTLLVHLDQDYLVDVGFGDSFRCPIPFPDGRTKDVSGEYKLFHRKDENYELKKLHDNDWLTEYKFTSVPRDFLDYAAMCNYQQDASSSTFRNRNVCTLATMNGRITLSNSSLTITENGAKTKFDVSSEKEFAAMLKKYFNIIL